MLNDIFIDGADVSDDSLLKIYIFANFFDIEIDYCYT